MITPELISYIKTERAKGSLDQIIKTTLLTQGWTEEDFAEAIKAIDGVGTTPEGADLVPARPIVVTTNIKRPTWRVLLDIFFRVIIIILIGLGVFFGGCVLLFTTAGYF